MPRGTLVANRIHRKNMSDLVKGYTGGTALAIDQIAKLRAHAYVPNCDSLDEWNSVLTVVF
jgi:hypothetical protein